PTLIGWMRGGRSARTLARSASPLPFRSKSARPRVARSGAASANALQATMDSSGVASIVQYGPSRGVAIAARSKGISSRVFKVWPEVGDPFRFEAVVVVEPRDADDRRRAGKVFRVIGSV